MNNNSCKFYNKNKFYPYIDCMNCNKQYYCQYKRPEMDEELKPFMDNLNNVLPNKS